MIMRVLALTLVFAMEWTVTAAAQVTIVVDQGPFASVEVAARGEAEVNWDDADRADDTACTECFAAVELQRYLRQMTGRAADFSFATATPSLGSVIAVGRNASTAFIDSGRLAALGPEGYIIKSVEAAGRTVLVITGGERVGTLYGVYDFLHRLGCRWFAPGDIHEEIPPAGLDGLPTMDVTEEPEFSLRGFHAWEDRGNDDFLIWMARNRMNYWCVEENTHALMHKLGIRMVWGGHVVTFDYLKPGDPYPYAHAKFSADKELPADPYAASPDFLGDENGDGVLSYIEAHPEWYGMNTDGVRVKTLRDGDYNWCTSNEDATAELIKNAVQELIDGKAKDATIVNCWTVDGGKWCQCDACKALGTPTDRNLLYIHAFDQGVKKAQADGRINRPISILFLAYADVLEPPTHPLPADFDYETCIATYFPICRCYVHNLDDATCAKNSDYAKNLYGWAVDPERYYKGQICIGEYYNVSGYKCLPVVYMHTMANDIPYYYDQANARLFHYMHVTTGHWGNKALTNYQMARQLWNHKADCEALWEDYFAKRYGPVAGEMRAFYESLETMLANVTELKYGLCGRLSRGDGNLFPSDHMPYARQDDEKGPSFAEILDASGACRRILGSVMTRSDLAQRVAERVAEDERLFAYGERTIAFYDALTRGYLAAREERADDARAAYAEAKELAELLKADTVSPTMSSSHASAPDALDASRAGAALGVLAERIGPLSPEEVPALDLSKEDAMLKGSDFRGGGGPVYGYNLYVFPEKNQVSDQGNYVYGQGGKPHNRMQGWCNVSNAPTGDVCAKVTGLLAPEPPGGSISGAVYINDTRVWEGNVPLAEREMSSFEFTFTATAFRSGLNKIVIENTESGGRLGSRPWFGVHEMQFRSAP